MTSDIIRSAASAFLVACALALATPTRVAAQDYAAIVAAPDRTDADRNTDKRRHPAEMLAFAGIKSGMKVLDMGAGGGYSTELLARTVGPTGKVWAQDSATPSERAKAAFDARMQKPAMKIVMPLARAFDDPVPADVTGLDAITFYFAYHDTTFMPIDRAKMNRALFSALKPGGVLVIADHSAKAGDGIAVAKTLHRIEESALKAEIEAAGFKLVASGDFLRHPEDPRDKRVFQPEVPVDEFVLKFERPR